jgi:hypothetical protein
MIPVYLFRKSASASRRLRSLEISEAIRAQDEALSLEFDFLHRLGAPATMVGENIPASGLKMPAIHPSEEILGLKP